MTAFVEEGGDRYPHVEFEPVEGVNDGRGASVVVRRERFIITVGNRQGRKNREKPQMSTDILPNLNLIQAIRET